MGQSSGRTVKFDVVQRFMSTCSI